MCSQSILVWQHITQPNYCTDLSASGWGVFANPPPHTHTYLVLSLVLPASLLVSYNRILVWTGD